MVETVEVKRGAGGRRSGKQAGNRAFVAALLAAAAAYPRKSAGCAH